MTHEHDADHRGHRRGRGWGTILKARDWFADLPVWGRWLVGVPTVLLVVLILAVSVDTAFSFGRIHPGVRVGDVRVGGLSSGDAELRTVEELSPRLEDPVTVVFEDVEWSVEATTVGASLDPATFIERAFSIGRTGNLWRRVRERVSGWIGGVEIEPVVTAEATAVAALMDGFDAEIGIDPVDASISIDGTTAELVPSAVGRGVDREVAERLVLFAFVSQDRDVELPTRLLPAAVADSDAEQALADARLMMSGPLVLSYESDEWDVGAEVIAEWIGFRAVPFGSPETTAASEATVTEDSTEPTAAGLPGRLVLQAYLAAGEVSETVAPMTGGVGRPAKDADFQVRNGVVTIIPAEVGMGVDTAALTTDLETVLREEDRSKRYATLRLQTLEPELTTEEAEMMGIQDRIATYTTNFSASNAPRVNNIHTLARALDNTLIPPGGTFSFNDAVGPRTAEKGYQEAGTIVNGQLVPTLGGGICQVCTTLFNTVFFAGLPVDQRSNHSFYISSYPTGRDATVSWGGPDFEFTNDTSSWILIATGYSSSSVTVSLYGTDPGFTVEYETGPWADVKPHGVKEIKDPDLDEGLRIVEDGGVDGRTVVVTRRVYRDDRLVREDSFRSRYNPKEEVVRVGTKPVPDSSEGTGSAGD